MNGTRNPLPWKGPLAVAMVLVLVAAVVPPAAGAYWLKILTLAVVYALAAAGVGVLYGRLGFVSLNQVALLGVGGWVFLRIGHLWSLPNPVLLLAAGLCTSLLGIVIGLPSLRLSGLNLALVTLMAAGAFEIVLSATGFPDGGDGFLGRAEGTQPVRVVPRPGFATSDAGVFRYTLLVAALMVALLWLFLRGRYGRAWAAIRQSEAGAYAAGVDVTFHRLVALALVSFVTGVGGGLLATGDGRLDSVSFPAQSSIVLFATVLIGGAFSLLGAVFAGLLYEALPALLNQVGIPVNLVYVAFGAGLVHALVTAPEGIAGQVLGLARSLRPGGRARPQNPTGHTGHRDDDRPADQVPGRTVEGTELAPAARTADTEVTSA